MLEGASAARHAFRVASGLDSMVLGEPQILGQLKQAVREADSAGTLGTTLQQMFQRSFAVAKEVRSSTEIGSAFDQHGGGRRAAGVAAVRRRCADTRVLFVGAGEMIELAATHFAARQPRQMAVANRTLERGDELASRFGAEAMPLADLPARLAEFDIVISCTASSLPIIGLGAVERALKARRHRPMFMVDLAVPRDIEARGRAPVRRLPLHRRRPVGAGPDRRREARGGGRAGRGDHRDRRAELRALARPARLGAADPGPARAGRRLARRSRSPAPRSCWPAATTSSAVLEALSRGLTQKMLHGTLAELRAADGDERARLAQTVSRLFLRAGSRAAGRRQALAATAARPPAAPRPSAAHRVALCPSPPPP